MSVIDKPVIRPLAAAGGVLRWMLAKPAVPIRARMRCMRWVQLHCVGTLVVMAFGAIFFWPILMRVDTYIPGWDTMFNAWTLARVQHCLMGQGCTSLADGNIFFPNHSSMLYSEMQLSSGLLTLPLSWINPNPIFSYNVWTISAYVLSSWCMYFLAMYMSRNTRWVSITAGLVFAYAPIKMTALYHMQNLSIFYLPLAVLWAAKYLRSRQWRYLVYLLVTLVLFFYASWYQMVFGLIVMGLLLMGVVVFRLGRFRSVLWLGAVVSLAVVSTLPLASQYIAFSKQSGARFDFSEQATYATRLMDYILPYEDTVVGWITKAWFPAVKVNGYNVDSSSYHGIVLLVIALVTVVVATVMRKRSPALRRMWRWAFVFGVVVFVGFVCSFGPYLQIYSDVVVYSGHKIPMPWLLVDKFLPQFSFIRAVGRASIVMLFGLCGLLAMLPAILREGRRARVRARARIQGQGRVQGRGRRRLWLGLAGAVLLVVGLGVDTMPLGRVPMSRGSFAYNRTVPAAYQFIRNNPEVDNLVVIYADKDYADATPDITSGVALVEPVLWAGYHNKNIFNGYSGYFPSNYGDDMNAFNHWTDDPVGRMRKYGLRYVLVDQGLSRSRPDLAKVVEGAGLTLVYQDERYVLLKLPS